MHYKLNGSSFRHFKFVCQPYSNRTFCSLPGDKQSAHIPNKCTVWSLRSPVLPWIPFCLTLCTYIGFELKNQFSELLSAIEEHSFVLFCFSRKGIPILKVEKNLILTSSHLQLGISISRAVSHSCWVIMISFYAILLWTTKGYYGNLYSFPLFAFFEQVVSLTVWRKWHIHWDIIWKSAQNCFDHSWCNVKLRFLRQSVRTKEYFLEKKKSLPKSFNICQKLFFLTEISSLLDYHGSFLFLL